MSASAMMLVFCHSAERKLSETTSFLIVLLSVAKGTSSDCRGQKAANSSYVTRPNTMAEADSSLEVRSRPISSLKKGELHSSGDSITPSSDMYVYEYSLLTSAPRVAQAPGVAST